MGRRGRLGVLVLVVLLLVAGALGAGARPASCVALVDGGATSQAATELRGYAHALQNGALDASYGHVMTLLALAEALDEAPRLGCGTEGTR